MVKRSLFSLASTVVAVLLLGPTMYLLRVFVESLGGYFQNIVALTFDASAFTGQAGYMFPRADGIILGGSFELDRWSTEPEPERISRIIASHRQLFAGFRCPDMAA